MTRLSDIPATADPVHLLLLGETKLGKSTYVAQMIEDGYFVVYVDADNGISAVRHHLRNKPHLLQNVLYYKTENPYKFVDGFLSDGMFRWNLTTDAKFASALSTPTDQIVEVIPSKMPKNIVLVVDSWSSMALDAMEIGADKKNVSLEDMGNESESVYGVAGMRLRLVCAVLQHAKFHVVVLAHHTYFERFERPPGVAGTIKRKDMILKETTKIPLSSSRPNGLEMGKYFNQIGWLEVDRGGRRMLDFTTEYGRIGGGTPNRKDVIENMSFSKLFGPVPPLPSVDESWIRYMTAEEFAAKQAASKPAAPAGVSASGVVSATPVTKSVSSMLLKKPT